MISAICIISLAFLSGIPNGLSHLTHGNFPLQKTYFPFYSNPQQYLIPQGALLPRILGKMLLITIVFTIISGWKYAWLYVLPNPFYQLIGYPIVSQRAVLKAEDFCVSRGFARTSPCFGGICRHPTYGIPGSLKKFYFPQVADITRARSEYTKLIVINWRFPIKELRFLFKYSLISISLQNYSLRC